MKATDKRNNGIPSILWLIIAGLFFICSCSKDDTPVNKVIRKEYRIAAVLPQKGADLKNAIEWSLHNLNNALADLRQIEITIEWFDEDKENIEKLFKDLADREDISAIIGPLYSQNASIAAKQCYLTQKTLIPATVSSETIMRQYSKKDFLWCLTENDISQCEVLLTRAIQKGAKSVSLLTSDDEYGITFWDWFAFQAHELDLTVHSIEKYNDTNVAEKMNDLLTEDTDYLICVPHNKDIAKQMNECRRKRSSLRPYLLFSDVAFITPKDITFEGMEGISQTHDPQSGFHVAYESKFDEMPSYGSAHYFDAITLAGLAILDADLNESTDINASLKKIVAGKSENINSTQETGIRHAVELLITGEYPHIDGASGKLYFDPTLYTNVIHSVYCHWQVYQGKHLILEYNTSDDSNRTNPSVANWNWKITKIQDFDKSSSTSYPPQEELYALIIAASSGWSNYRHQANAYSVYQLLKKNGVKDDHILLVSEDDIAFNSENFTPGYIQSPAGDNIYEGITVDYHPSDIDLDKLSGILSGETETGSPHPGSKDNLFVYWAGHGEPEGPIWLNKIIPSYEIADFFHKLSMKQCFRKIFFAMETCYAGQIGISCEDQKIKGMLCFTAANEKETSKAYATDASGQTWISNSFTYALLDQLNAEKGLSIYNLYHNVYNLTIGSHASIYNAANFGNLYTAQINEFLHP